MLKPRLCQQSWHAVEGCSHNKKQGDFSSRLVARFRIHQNIEPERHKDADAPPTVVKILVLLSEPYVSRSLRNGDGKQGKKAHQLNTRKTRSHT